MITISDKLRTTFPIAVTFTEGELPSADKMNGLSTQAKNGLGMIEYVIGDVWNQSGDPILGSVDDAMLMIPNIARYLGPTRHTNPRIPNLANISAYTHVVTSAENGKHHFRLPFPPSLISTYSWDNGFDALPQALKGQVNGTGKWYIDIPTGEIWCYDAVSTGDQIVYQPVVAGDLGSSAAFNIIPDPDTDTGYGFRGLKIRYKNGLDDSEGYEIFLPPRQPLDTRRTNNSPADLVHAGHSENISTTPSTEQLFWQADSVDADVSANAAHYRYNLPEILTSNWSSGSTIPVGFLYLWDPHTTKTVIECCVFSAEAAASPSTWMLIATGANLTTWLQGAGAVAYPASHLKSPANGGTSDSHAASHYPNAGLRLVTVGTDVSTALSSLIGQFLDHDHSSAGSLVSRRVTHALLGDLYDNTYTPKMYPSFWSYDDHPQYIHRHGSSYRGAYPRDYSHGAMLGDLFMGSLDSSNHHINLTLDSYGIRFGSDTIGPYIHYDQLEDALQIDNKKMWVQGGVIRHNPGIHFIDVDLGTGYSGSWTFGDHGHGVGYDTITHWECQTPGNLWFDIVDWPEGIQIWQVEVWCWPNGPATTLSVDGFYKQWGASGATVGAPPTFTPMTSLGPTVSDPGSLNVIVLPFVNSTMLTHEWTHGYRSAGAGEKLVLKIGASTAGMDVYGIRLTVLATSGRASVNTWAG